MRPLTSGLKRIFDSQTPSAYCSVTCTPSPSQVYMSGSDVVVVGMVGSSCFAADYYLRGRNQCNYGSGGVRPPPLFFLFQT